MTRFSPLLAARVFWQTRVRKRPFVMSHAINSRCNMRCSFCEYWKEEGQEMPLEEVYALLDEARSFGIGIYNAWTVEPLLREDLPLILARAKKLGMITFLITNGKLLEKRLDDLGDLDYLSVSLDGLKSYREIRGMDVEKILDGIKKARVKLRNPLLLNCVISGKNLDDIEELIHLAKELQVKISFEPLYEFSGIEQEVWENMGIHDLDKYKNVVDRIMEMKRQGYPVINSYRYLKMVRDLKMDWKCHANDLILNVASDGTIESCRVHRQALGNVKEGIANVWEASKQQRKASSDACPGCLFFGYVENSLMYEFDPDVIRHYEWM